MMPHECRITLSRAKPEIKIDLEVQAPDSPDEVSVMDERGGRSPSARRTSRGSSHRAHSSCARSPDEWSCDAGRDLRDRLPLASHRSDVVSFFET
jgi:hypothetical protein